MFKVIYKGLQMTTNHNKRLSTVKNIPNLYPGLFSESSIRWLLFNRRKNGFSSCVRKMGFRLLIDLDEFEKWIDNQKEAIEQIAS